MDRRPTIDAPDDDPYLWLEEVDGPEALAWVAAQNARTMAELAGPAFDADRDALRAILDRPDNIPHVTRRGGLLYNFWQDAAQPRGVWRRTTMDSYRTASPAWDVLLDLDAQALADGEDWVWHGAATLPPLHARALLRLSRGGGDAVVVREFDLPSRSFVRDGFILPEAKSDVAWVDHDTLLLMTALDPAGTTTSGYARKVQSWRRGEDPLSAATLFEVEEGWLGASGGYERGQDRVSFAAQIGFFDSECWLGPVAGGLAAPATRLDLPTDATVQWDGDWLAVRPRTAWEVGGHVHAADSVLGIGLQAFLSGNREFQVLFSPERRRAFRGLFWVAGTLVIAVFDTLQAQYLVATPGHPWTTRPVEGLPGIGTVSLWPLDADDMEADGTLLGMVQTPVTPPTLSLIEPAACPRS